MLKTIEQWGDQRRYPELFDAAGKRLPQAKPYQRNENNGTALYGADIDHKGMRFSAVLAVNSDGKISAAADGTLQIEDATEAKLVLGAGSSFNGHDRSPSRAGPLSSASAERRPCSGGVFSI